MSKKIVKQYLCDLSTYSVFDGKTIDEVVEYLLEIKQSHANSRIIFYVTHCGYDNEIEIHLIEERLETDEEYKERLTREERKKREKQSKANAKAKAEEKDRKEYERLKKKFEGT